jgi:DNA repair exonuclease SbcCD ATPase subunit
MLESLEEHVAELERESRAFDWLADAFSTTGIRAKVLNTVTVPYLNARLEKHSSTMGFPCQLTTEVESKGGKKEDKIDPVLTGKRTYKGCSRGEKRKVDLSIQCAINDLSIATGGSKVNLLIADEVIDPLDDQGVQAFINILQEKSQASTVLLMTHKPFVDSFAGKRWSLVKSGGVTSLIEA